MGVHAVTVSYITSMTLHAAQQARDPAEHLALRRRIHIFLRIRIDHSDADMASGADDGALVRQTRRSTRLDIRRAGARHEPRKHEVEVGCAAAARRRREVDVQSRVRWEHGAGRGCEQGLYESRRELGVDQRGARCGGGGRGGEGCVGDLRGRRSGEGNGGEAFFGSFACRTAVVYALSA